MTRPAPRKEICEMVAVAIKEGASQAKACAEVGLSARTMQRWRKDANCVDGRSTRIQQPAGKLSELECEQMLTIADSPKYGQLAPSQIVPRLADQGIYLAPESSFYRLFRRLGLIRHRHAVRVSDLAAELMRDICRRESIQPAQVVLHSDNGTRA